MQSEHLKVEFVRYVHNLSLKDLKNELILLY